MNRNKAKVYVGVSGGVDSSVALALLQKAGYSVTGVFLKVWSPDWMECDWKEERRSAMCVCATLGVPFLTFDFEKEYKKEVVDYMIREYSLGRVPNPDIFCNKYVKFGVFLQKALEMGADYVATGHYAQISFSSYFSESTDKSLVQFSSVSAARLRSLSSEHDSTKSYNLLESVYKEKDQSYFLYTLDQNQLAHTLFPVGEMTKPEVRKLAKKFELPTAEKKDSQGLCFLGKIDMKNFLSHYIKAEPGNVLNTKGKIIGYHKGAIFFAIGQRHGFTITEKSANDPRFFVVAKDLKKNTITVASRELESEKMNNIKEIILKNLNFINPMSDIGLGKSFNFTVRIRYRQEKQKCTLYKKSDDYHIVFNTPQNAISVGQSAVLYDGEICLGGGIIEKCI